ncbi:unnamed protein product [Rotaria sp. Silwood2]|nr:unnamed protein product [Rotaria sp. Silwood2]
MLLTALAKDYEFDEIYFKPPYSQEQNSSQLSYENLYTSEPSATNNHLTIRYIWLLGESIDNSTFTINYVFVNITSEPLIETLLVDNTQDLAVLNDDDHKKQLNIIRTSTLTSKDIDANWKLAPDLEVITEKFSILGGLWSSTYESIQKIPHAITLEEATQLQQFFLVVALGKLADSLGIDNRIS